MMKFKVPISAALIIALAATGCQSNQDKASAPSSAGSTPVAANESAPKAGNELPSPSGAQPSSPAPAPSATNPSLSPEKSGKAPNLKPPETIRPVPKNIQVPSPPQEGWSLSDLSPEQIAKAADEAIASARGLDGDVLLRLKDPQGTGEAVSKVQIQNPSKFAIQYTELESGEPHTFTFKADGRRRGLLLPATQSRVGGWVKRAPIGTKGTIPSGSKLVEAWPTRFPRLVLASLFESRTPFSDYVAAIKRGAGGYTLASERRVLQYKGQSITSYRIVASRKADAARKLGASRVEMIFDGHYRLPVTIRTNVTPSSGVPTDLLWTAGWNFGKKYSDDTFVLPNKLN